MKNLKRLFAMLLCTFVVMTAVPVNSFAVTQQDCELLLNKYNNLIQSPAVSEYGLPCQPHDALYLNPSMPIILDVSDVTDVYRGGVVNLPRLSSDYYYQLDTIETGFELGNTMYPTLLFRNNSINEQVTLTIHNKDTHEVMENGTYVIQNPNISNGVDYWYSGEDIYDVDGSSVLYDGATFEDASKDVLSNLVTGPTHYYDGVTHCYNSMLHKTSIVMPTYMYTTVNPEDVLTDKLLSLNDFNTVNVLDGAYTFKRKEVGTDNIQLAKNVKKYLTTNLYGAVGNARPALLVTGSKSAGCTYNSTSGEVVTTLSRSDASTELYYAIAVNGKCYFGIIGTDTVSSSEYSTAVGSSNMTWKSDTYYNLEDGYVLTNGGLATGLSDEEKAKFKYGPVSFDTFWDTAVDKYGVEHRRGMYEFWHENEVDKTGMNVFAETLFFSGCAPHLANVKLLKRPYTVELSFYEQKPNSTEWSYVGIRTLDKSSMTINDLITLNDIEHYTKTEWCTDTACTKPFTLADVSENKNYKISLYAKHNYTGGNYTVTFYNDVTNSTKNGTFRVVDMPAFPATPIGKGGYAFKNYEVFEDSLDGKSLGLFNPETFTPVAGKTYVFKTKWTPTGAILKVVTSKVNYFVGEEIDKSLLEVIVQESDNPDDTRKLNPVEFTVTNGLVSAAGKHTFYVTYTATGSVGDCTVTGIEVVPESLNAYYNGGEVPIGTILEQNDFVVKVHYNNNTDIQVTNFTMSPNKISDVGNTTVKLTWGNMSTSVKVKGYAVNDDDDATGKDDVKLKSISATYIGPTVYVNDTIPNSSVKLIAKYSDKSKVTVASNLFALSPTSSKYSGELVLKVSYGGLTTTCKVTVYEHEDDGDGNVIIEDTDDDDSDDDDNTDNSDSSDDTDASTSDSDNDDKSSEDSKNDDKTSSTDKKDESTSTGTGSTSGKDADKDEKGASPYYIHGATILTNVTGEANATEENKVDVLKLVKDASPSVSSLDVTLVNGLVGNDITLDVVKELKSKLIQLNVNMVSPADRTTTVARWTIYGANLNENSLRPLNPNITFEKVDKVSDTVLYMSPQNQPYMEGVSLELLPEVAAYRSGESVTLYSCDNNKANSKFVASMIWKDEPLNVAVDVLSTRHYAFSNAPMTYAEGSSLAEEVDKISVSENSILDDYTDSDTEDSEEVFDFGEDTEDGTTSDDVGTSSDSSAYLDDAKKVAGLAGISNVITIVCAILLLVVTIWACVTKPKFPEDYT